MLYYNQFATIRYGFDSQGRFKLPKKDTGTMVAKSLRDLEDLLVPLPELPTVEELDIDNLEARAEKVREAAEQVQGWVQTTLAQLDMMNRASREAKELAARAIANSQKKLDDLLHREEMPAYRRAAWTALLRHELAKDLRTREEVERLLERLVREERLVEDPAGLLEAYRKRYAIPPDSLFEEPEATEIHRAMGQLLLRVYREVGRDRAKRSQDLWGQKTIDWRQLVGGVPGKYVGNVPPQEGRNADGTTFWRAGGTLLVECVVRGNERRIYPLDATGGIEAAVREARELGVYLFVDSLGWNRPPKIPGLSLEQGSKVQLVWYLLQRAGRNEEEEEGVRSDLERLDNLADIAPEDFFLNRQVGTCLARYDGVWKVPTTDGRTGAEVPHLFFLVERVENGDVAKIRIVEAPEHLRDLLANCMAEYPEEGERFQGCPYPLRAILQAIFGQVAKSAQIANQ